MQKITNLTNSPFDLQGANGLIRLPAFGSVKGEFTGEMMEVLHASGAVSVEEVDTAPVKAPAKGRSAARKSVAAVAAVAAVAEGEG